MKLITLLIVSSISFGVFAQNVENAKSDTPDKIVENAFIKIQKDRGVDENKVKSNLNSIKNHKDQNFKSKYHRLSTEEVIAHQLYIGLVNSAPEFNEKNLPADVLKTISNVCVKYAHTDSSVANSCGNDQFKDLVNAIKVFVDDEGNASEAWKEEFQNLVDVVNASHSKQEELQDAARSFGADSEEDAKLGEQDDPEADSQYNRDRYEELPDAKKAIQN